MAERLFRDLLDGRHKARSAGRSPGEATHPVVLEALAEIGIDASDHVPAPLDDDLRRDGVQPPFAGHALELVGAAVVEGDP